MGNFIQVGLVLGPPSIFLISQIADNLGLLSKPEANLKDLHKAQL